MTKLMTKVMQIRINCKLDLILKNSCYKTYDTFSERLPYGISFSSNRINKRRCTNSIMPIKLDLEKFDSLISGGCKKSYIIYLSKPATFICMFV